MRILFLTEGGNELGFGHLTRCLAIVAAITKLNPEAKVEFTVNNKQAEEFIAIGGFNVSSFDWCADMSRTVSLARQKEVVVIDSYMAGPKLYELLANAELASLFIIDDCKRLDYPAGIIISPSVYGKELDYRRGPGLTYLAGSDYIIIGKEFWHPPVKVINKEVKKILLTLGGSDCHSIFLDQLSSFLMAIFNFNINIIDVRKKRIDSAQMVNFMIEADICICGGGQTTNEVLRIGLPTIGICFADNQLLNLEWMQRAGYLEYVGWYSDPAANEIIAEAISRLSCYNLRQQFSNSGKKIVDGRGAMRIAEAILSVTCRI
ncbi:MAG: hypothetical protein ABH952_09780 [Candidatus Omnitrophota bacterium]